MIRVAFVSTMEAGLWGGSEELWSQAAQRLAERRAIVGVNIARHDEIPPKIAQLIAAGCQITRRPLQTSLFARALRRVFCGGSLRWLADFRPDLAVISQGDHLSGWPWMAECARRGIPYVTIAQMAYANDWPCDKLRERIAQAYAGARANFFVSQANLELTRRQLAHPLPRAEVVRNPFNVRYDATPEWPGDNASWKLACIARLDPSAKGQDALFDVLRQDKWRDRPVEVTLFGDGARRQGLAALKEMYELGSVRFAGSVDDIEEIWSEHHGLVLPSRYEGLPLVVVEAMLCGRMCIVTDVGGNSEMVEDGVTGFVAASPEPRALDQAMERAWEARGAWRQMGQAGARRARSVVPCDPVGAFVERLLALAPSK